MADRRPDPFDTLRAAVSPLAPEGDFADSLRERLRQAVSVHKGGEPLVSTDLSRRARNGFRHGDVSYISVGLPDLARGKTFYGSVLGWSFTPGSSEHGVQVDRIVPMMGLWEGEQTGGCRIHGAVLGFRVDDIAAAVAAVRSHGGVVGDPHEETDAVVSEGHDDQGAPFYLLEMAPGAEEPHRDSDGPWNGQVEGDVSYLTMVTRDVEAARAFYGAAFGWTFNVGRAGGVQVTGVAPQIGMTSAPQEGPATHRVIVCYRVDDIVAAVQRVRQADGRAETIVQRPYGLESLCSDDQGTPFYLHQF